MASLIYEETGTGQDREGERVSELAMKSEPFVLEASPAPVDLTANQGNVLAARLALAPVVERVYRHRLPVRISHWLNVPILYHPDHERTPNFQRASRPLLGRPFRS